MSRRDWARDFLAALECGGSVTLAAQCAGIARETAYRRRDRWPTFKAEWDRALDRHQLRETRVARARLAQIAQQTQHGDAAHWRAWRLRDRPDVP